MPLTTHLCKNEVEILQMVTSILLKFLTLKWDISRTIWHTEVSDGPCFAFLPSFIWAQVIFYQSFPLTVYIDQSTMWSLLYPMVTWWSIMAVRAQMEEAKASRIQPWVHRIHDNSSNNLFIPCVDASKQIQLHPEAAMIFQFCVALTRYMTWNFHLSLHHKIAENIHKVVVNQWLIYSMTITKKAS